MESFLQEPIKVPFDHLYPDPNNPRLGLPEVPGYGNVEALFDEDTRTRVMSVLGEGAYGADELVQAIIGQGWMPIDNIITWNHPSDGTDRHVVVEGNRRLISLWRIRTSELEKHRRRLRRIEQKAQSYPIEELRAQRDLVKRLEQVKSDTDQLLVVPVDAPSIAELHRKLPRVLAVRHINGAKDWGNYARDLWLLNRYQHLFSDKHGGDSRAFWDNQLVQQVANEASQTPTMTKRQLKAASWFGHFRAAWEDDLPDEKPFVKEDYYLFEIISRKPWVRQQLDIGEDDFSISPEREAVLFEWIFKLPRGRNADENPNVFYRHQNVMMWDDMNKYDQKHGTSFAAEFDVTDPSSARTMHEVEPEWLSHKAKRRPQAIIDDLLARLNELTAEKLATEGTALRAQLKQLHARTELFIKMIDATES
jgi:hypothetical protein